MRLKSHIEVEPPRRGVAWYRPGRMATLAEFAKRWQEKYGCLRKPSTFKAQASHLRIHIIPALGTLQLNEISMEEQQRFVTRLTKTVRRKTLLNVLQTLSVMLNVAKDFLSQAPWMAIWPGTAIFLVVMGFNLLGDGLCDSLDPRET